MRRVGAGLALVMLAGCSAGQINDATSKAPILAPPAPELTSTSTPAVPVTVEVTTTTEPEPTTVPAVIPPIPPRPSPTTTQYLQPATTTQVLSGNCGGTLPPCYVMARESRGSLTVYNYEGSGASGKWQIMPGTWNGYSGYANAADAPETVQDAKARLLWSNGAGCWHWDAC